MIIKLCAYCACAACCGPGSQEAGGLGITASGDYPRQGITIAAPRKVKLGTKVKVRWPDGTERILTVQDRTAKRINGWDLYLASHLEAVRFGVQYVKIEILGGGAGSGGSIPRAASSNAYSQRSPTAPILGAPSPRSARVVAPAGARTLGGWPRSIVSPPVKTPQAKSGLANGARTQRRAVVSRPHPGNAPASFTQKRK